MNFTYVDGKHGMIIATTENGHTYTGSPRDICFLFKNNAPEAVAWRWINLGMC